MDLKLETVSHVTVYNLTDGLTKYIRSIDKSIEDTQITWFMILDNGHGEMIVDEKDLDRLEQQFNDCIVQ